MSLTATKEMHPFEAAVKAGRVPYKVKDLRSPSSAARRSVSPSMRCPA
jgi:hypothetical protein